MSSNLIHSTVSAKDKYLHFVFCFLPLFPFLLLLLGIQAGGLWLALPSMFLQFVLPVLDWLSAWKDDYSIHEQDFSALELTLLKWNTRLYGLLYIATICWLVLSIERFSRLETGFLVAAMSLITAIGFAASHELMHTRGKLDQLIQGITTMFLFYPHYKLIHIYNHHPHVATREDRNCAHFNESIYAYILRSIPGSAAKCWEIEAKQVEASGKRGVLAILHNRMLRFALGQVLLLVGIYWIGSGPGLLFYLAQVIGGNIIMESVNYIQHYGIERQQSPEKNEKITTQHAWDTYHFFSSYATYRVGHHAPHHVKVKPYYLVGTDADSPKLPKGYFYAIPMVLLPPIWRSRINPILATKSR